MVVGVIKSLQKDGSVLLIRGGTKPKYELVPWSELEQNRAPARKPMTVRQRTVFEMVAAGEQPKGSDAQVAAHLARAGWLARDASSRFFIPSETEPTEPDWIWLPNELVTRAASEIPPVELVRQSQDVMTLRLLVDFYHSQNLREDGGIGRHFTWQKFERFEMGRQAQFTIWGFRYESDWVGWNGPTTCHWRDTLTDEEKAEGKTPGGDFFRRQQQLADLGLIEWVPHLFESADRDAEIIHPLGMNSSQSMDDRLGAAAHRAGLVMLTEGQREWAAENELRLVPVPRHIANVQMIGIARLRYRPKTKLTATWFAELQTKGERYIQRYSELAAARTEEAVSF